MRSILILSLLSLLTVSKALGQSAVKIESHLMIDSTRFELTPIDTHHLKEGTKFAARIHVTPGAGWHVYSMKSSPGYGGPVPMTVSVPPELAPYFTILRTSEVGKPKVVYDSEFSKELKSFSVPFDVVVTLQARKDVSKAPSFHLWVNFQVCSSSMCIPPRTFSVPMVMLLHPNRSHASGDERSTVQNVTYGIKTA